eukprot:2294760-Prymnesium_polylepis.2
MLHCARGGRNQVSRRVLESPLTLRSLIAPRCVGGEADRARGARPQRHTQKVWRHLVKVA